MSLPPAPQPNLAQLDWDERGQPLSRQFDDVYFSRENGLAETQHVFLDGNNLTERFGQLHDNQRFVIGETGFGTGLNFLCAWQLFEQHVPKTAYLHMVSVEKYPLSLGDLSKALRLWPELATHAEALLQSYRAINPGFQQMVFAEGRVTLTLLIGDVLEQLPQLDAQVDAWFLDGFAPAKNPDMWTETLFTELARLSAPHATLGTFTSAGFVRRGLTSAGFEMQRVPGYGRKREVLKGYFRGNPQPKSKIAPWYTRPNTNHTMHRHAIIIGAGLAGCATAASLAARGWHVQILERHDQPAQEGSGNPQGILYLKLSAYGTMLSQLIISGFGYTRRILEQLTPEDWSACGVLQLAIGAKEERRQQQLIEHLPTTLLKPLPLSDAEQLAGVKLPAGGIFFPEAGWLHPPALCRHLLQHPSIEKLYQKEAFKLERNGELWRVQDERDQMLAEAPVVILACATEALRFTQTASLPIKAIRGQITRLPATAASSALQTVLCAEGYIAPEHKQEHTLGASFALHATDLALTPEEHQSNLDLLNSMSPALGQALNTAEASVEMLQGRAAFRCTTTDYLPLVGPIADMPALSQAYAVLRKDARQRPNTECPWLEGLYLNIAHGSRGLITAPLSAELLASWLNNEPLPLPRALAEACHPNRFGVRKIIRGQ